ncbi:MAG: LPS export ABC transporter permease LptF [Pseudomonadota bacterium]
MVRLDRYILSQLLLLFGFFALVLVSVFWINRAVLLFDRLISDGQSALVFLEFTALGLPSLVTLVMPIASFAAAVYVTNRLNNESELTVMLATGTSPFRLARPILIFGLVVFTMSSILHHVLLPLSKAQLSLREAEVAQNATARLLTEGAFLNPADGITFYTREIQENGVLRDVFLTDRRDTDEEVIYTSDTAYLLGDETTTTAIMVDGLAQRLDLETNRLSTTNFRDFSIDISALVRSESIGNTPPGSLTSFEFLGDWNLLHEKTGRSTGTLAEELHSRFAEPLFCIVAALIGFSTLLVGGYSRFGIWREITISFGLLLLLDGARSAMRDPVQENAALWLLLYLPAAIGVVLTIGMLLYVSRPRRRRKRQAKVPA